MFSFFIAIIIKELFYILRYWKRLTIWRYLMGHCIWGSLWQPLVRILRHQDPVAAFALPSSVIIVVLTCESPPQLHQRWWVPTSRHHRIVLRLRLRPSPKFVSSAIKSCKSATLAISSTTGVSSVSASSVMIIHKLVDHTVELSSFSGHTSKAISNRRLLSTSANPSNEICTKCCAGGFVLYF